MTSNPSNDGLFVMSRRFTSRAVVVFTALLFHAMAYSAPASAQVCTPDVISLTSQEDVDNFQSDHGPCDQVGALTVEYSDITNLDGLSALTSVDWRLLILENDALSTLNGLSALTSVGDLFIELNDALINLDGLSALSSVGGNLLIYSNC